MKDRFQTLLLMFVLIGVGALLGSFWLEWRGPRLESGAVDISVEGDARLDENPAERLKVEVLNGSGEPGSARVVAMRLRSLGFDVVYFGNAESFDHEHTRVINRSGAVGIARGIADSLGVDSVGTDVAPELYLDATLLLGSDWRNVLDFQ